MITFGIMTLNMESETSYIDQIAKLADSCEMECFRFIPSKINPHTLLVKGKKFNAKDQTWAEGEFPIPSILYDRCFYGDDEHSKQCIPIVSWLKCRNDITFLGYGLPNKLELYNVLKNSVLTPYLPPTMKVSNPGEVLKELKIRNRIILKPISGSQGYGIYYVKQNDKSFHVKTEKQKKIISHIFQNELKLNHWLNSLMVQRDYLLQPFLELANDHLQPFDIRILIQKNEHGDWVTRGKGVRQGTTGGILSNLSSGGSVIRFADWLAFLPPAKREYIRNELTFITANLPRLLEQEFLPLFELGVDIGVARNGAIWILDVNSKPGRKVILETKPELKETLYLAPLLYGKHISKLEQTERKSSYATTLFS
ncbi:YheC/YheD family protein [Neobacillus massiliamazoniensis]|uniref:Glutathione synthetase ATP-binding domain-like protein n=1 Tax=Neobacillus massiliamazoniensis TaxID=1499688 RepID=A0A0U1NZU5_9BACI|nr:YheC/YheD family protein [Neobacillus massiliamazoniensis]CRK83559.1 glutathione synthetase ATP-binding domain-like protein [Neobacillus massiliamazoniensis]